MPTGMFSGESQFRAQAQHILCTCASPRVASSHHWLNIDDPCSLLARLLAPALAVGDGNALEQSEGFTAPSAEDAATPEG